jgi:hypothetical protein
MGWCAFVTGQIDWVPHTSHIRWWSDEKTRHNLNQARSEGRALGIGSSEVASFRFRNEGNLNGIVG